MGMQPHDVEPPPIRHLTFAEPEASCGTTDVNGEAVSAVVPPVRSASDRGRPPGVVERAAGRVATDAVKAVLAKYAQCGIPERATPPVTKCSSTSCPDEVRHGPSRLLEATQSCLRGRRPRQRGSPAMRWPSTCEGSAHPRRATPL